MTAGYWCAARLILQVVGQSDLPLSRLRPTKCRLSSGSRPEERVLALKLLPLVSFALLVVPVSPVLAQTQGQAAAPARPADGLSVTGSLRVRGEVLRGQARAGLGAQDDVVSQRALIAIEYRSGAWRIGGELQDARVHGADAGSAITANDVNTLEPVQAYVGWTGRDLFGSGTRVEVLAGRQTLNIGSRRLVAADEYRNTTNG